jgi:hypothetical protein
MRGSLECGSHNCWTAFKQPYPKLIHITGEIVLYWASQRNVICNLKSTKDVCEEKYKATCNRLIGALITKPREELNICREVIICYVIYSYIATLDSGGTDSDGDGVLELIVMANWTTWWNYRAAAYVFVRGTRICAVSNSSFLDITHTSRCYVTSVSCYPTPHTMANVPVYWTPLIPPSQSLESERH